MANFTVSFAFLKFGGACHALRCLVRRINISNILPGRQKPAGAGLVSLGHVAGGTCTHVYIVLPGTFKLCAPDLL